VIYKKQATIVDYPLNIIHLDSEEHRGDLGPHKNRETDLKYKRQLESQSKGYFRQEPLYY